MARGEPGSWRYWAIWDNDGQLDLEASSGGEGIVPGMPRNEQEFAVLLAARRPDHALWSPRKAGGTWRIWTGTHYREDDSEQPGRDLVILPAAELAMCAAEVRNAIEGRLARIAVRERERERKRLTDRASAAVKFASRMMTATGHAAAMVKMKPVLGVPDDLFRDHWPQHLNTPWGVHDLETGRIWPHDPRTRMAYVLPCHPVWHGKAPLFRALIRHLATTQDGYSEAIEAFILRVLGYALLGDNREQVWIWFLGQTQSGKSVLQELMRLLLGPLAAEGDKSLVLVSRDRPHARAQNNLRGRRLVFFPEWGEHDHADETSYKRMTGESRLSLDELYAVLPNDTETTFLPVTFTNDMPTIGDADSAVARRTIVCPAGLTLPDAEQVKGLAQLIFRSEGEAVLGILMTECAAYLKDGLTQPHEVTMATESYLGMQRREVMFIDEHCARKEGGHADGRALWTLWERWSESRSVRLSRTKFYRRIAELPGVSRETNHASMNKFWGIEILPEYSNPYLPF
jgi:P4 family phage/plasmid primase-like protien